MENEDGYAIQLRVRIEAGKLVEKAILCPSCGGETRTYKACGGDGACCALLACMQCGNRLAECAIHEEMERSLERNMAGRLRPTCFARERISRGRATAPVIAPAVASLRKTDASDGISRRGNHIM